MKFLKGFTMIELLTVIAIIAILAGMLLPALNRARQQAWETTARTMISSLEAALANYMTDYGDYPQDDTGTCESCINLIDKIETGDYASFRSDDKDGSGNLLDPWGAAYCYRYQTGTVQGASYGLKYNIWSKGNDTSVTTDDITNWRTSKGQ
jgi:general secretion pathway protein G